MMNEEDVKRFAEAKKCDSCLQWHKYCNAECCKMLTINGPKELLEGGAKYFSVNVGPMESSDQIYYQLRDVEYTRGKLRFLKERCFMAGNKIIYWHPCKLLNGCLCSGHPNRKPELCKALTKDNANLPGQKFLVTENCLFKYK